MKEILLMTGFSFIGILFTDVSGWTNWLKNITVFFFVFFYVLAVFAMNSFADYEKDKHSKRLKIVGDISKQTYIQLFILFCVLFGVLSYAVNVTVLILSLSSLLLWGFYYLQPLRLKSTFLGGTLIHLLAGVLHFHTGYCSYQEYGIESLTISINFALLLSAGHFHHEIMDYDDDKSTGSKTTAVRIGKDKVLLLRTVLIAFTLFYWNTLFFFNIIETIAFYAFVVPTATLLIMSLIMRDKEIKKFQKISRAIFLIAGIAMILVKLAANANYF